MALWDSLQEAWGTATARMSSSIESVFLTEHQQRAMRLLRGHTWPAMEEAFGRPVSAMEFATLWSLAIWVGRFNDTLGPRLSPGRPMDATEMRNVLPDALAFCRCCAAVYGWRGLLAFPSFRRTTSREDQQRTPSEAPASPLPLLRDTSRQWWKNMSDSVSGFVETVGAAVQGDRAAAARLGGFEPDHILYFHEGESQFGLPKHMVVIRPRQRAVVLVIRGTISPDDVLTDVVCRPISFLHGEAHEGMAMAAHALYMNLLRKHRPERLEREAMPSGSEQNAQQGETDVLQWLLDHPEFRFVVTGHSMGAGVAILFTLLALHHQGIGPSAEEAPVREGTDATRNPLADIAIECHAFAPPPVVWLPGDVPTAWMEHVHIYMNKDDIVPYLCIGRVVDLLKTMADLRAARTVSWLPWMGPGEIAHVHAQMQAAEHALSSAAAASASCDAMETRAEAGGAVAPAGGGADSATEHDDSGSEGSHTEGVTSWPAEKEDCASVDETSLGSLVQPALDHLRAWTQSEGSMEGSAQGPPESLSEPEPVAAPANSRSTAPPPPPPSPPPFPKFPGPAMTSRGSASAVQASEPPVSRDAAGAERAPVVPETHRMVLRHHIRGAGPSKRLVHPGTIVWMRPLTEQEHTDATRGGVLEAEVMAGTATVPWMTLVPPDSPELRDILPTKSMLDDHQPPAYVKALVGIAEALQVPIPDDSA